MTNPLADKVALVTGAGSGIGRATALLMAERGAKVAALGLTKPGLEQTVDAIGKMRKSSMLLQADISHADEMETAVGQILDEWGRLDIVFANAGINGTWAPIEELDPDEWERTLRVNLSGTFFTIKYAVPHMKQNGGSIIVTASINGTRTFSNTGATAYSTTKAGQLAMMKMLALELAKHKIRVNAICPGAIDTNIEESTDRQSLERATEPIIYPEGDIPLTDGTPGTAHDVAQLVAFLASDEARHITGTEMWIDGGQSLMRA